MLTKSRTTLGTALAVATLAAAPSPALADWNVQGSPPNDGRQNAASEIDAGAASSTTDARGENAASLSQTPDGTAPDQRSPDAREQFVPPVVVEVGGPVSSGFDWTSAIAGMAGGLALAILAIVGVSGVRRRQVRPVV